MKAEKDSKKITFTIKDIVLGSNLDSTNFTLPVLAEFIDQVSAFLRGSGRQDLRDIKSSMISGSLFVTAEDQTGILEDAFADYELLQKNEYINVLDPMRADIVDQWQTSAKQNKSRVYEIFMGDKKKKTSTFLISSKTNYVPKKETWVEVNLYLYGTVYDLGGKNKANVHVELENGKSVKIDTNTSMLARDKNNRLYKKQLVRIKAKRNIDTHELKDEHLLSFEYYNPEFDKDDFDRISKKAKVAWKSVENATEWVEKLRGNHV